MTTGWRPPAYEVSVPDINRLFQPIKEGFETRRKAEQQNVENERQNKLMGFREQEAGRAQQKFDADQEDAKAHRFGKTMSALAQQPPDVIARVAPEVFKQHPEYVSKMGQFGINPADTVGAVKMLAQNYGAYDPLEIAKQKAQIDQSQQAAAASRQSMTQAGQLFPGQLASQTAQVQQAQLAAQAAQRDFNNPPRNLQKLKDDEALWDVPKGPGEPSRLVAGTPHQKSPPGYRPTQTGDLEAIPGGPADIKMNEKRQQDFASARSMIQQLDEYAAAVNSVATAPGLASNFGMAGMVPNRPGGAAADAQAQLDTLRTKGAFATLQEMRNASKSGGALGAVSDNEQKMLQNAIAPLQKVQSHQQAVQSLNSILKHIEDSKARIRAAYDDHWNNGGAAAKQPLGSTPPPASPPGTPPGQPQKMLGPRTRPPPPPSGAVQMLQGNPNLAADFDAKYGAGAAARVLGGN